MNTVEFLDPKKNSHIIRPEYLKNFYLNLNYHLLPKNIFLKKIILFINIIFLRKLRIIFNFVKNLQFNFGEPSKYDIIVFDDESFNILSNIFSKKNYFILQTRIARINKVYLSKKIVLLIIKNFFKASLKVNYLCSLIEIINPKIVVTFIDNSTEFSMSVKILKNKNIKFIAIQNAHRTHINYKKVRVNIPNYYVFADYEREILLKSDSSYKNIIPVGSLTAAVAKKYLREKHDDLNEDLFDICFISEPHFKLNQDFGHIHQETNYKLQESVKALANNVLKFCKKHKKKMIFSGKADISSEYRKAEILSYKNMVDDHDFEISFHKKKEFINYKNIMQSKLIIGMNSTILRESFEFNKKVLWCNLVGHIDTKSPAEGICELKSKNFEDFEKRVLDILELNFEQYLSKIKNPDRFYNFKIDTLDFLRSEIDTSINEKLRN